MSTGHTADAAPQVQGRANVQYNGKKAFEAVWLHLNGTGQLDLRHQKGQPVARRGCVLGCSVGAPNSARKGHPHSIRLDLREADSKGVAKYVVSLESAEEKEHWEACLRVYAGMAAAAGLADSSAAAAAASTVAVGVADTADRAAVPPDVGATGNQGAFPGEAAPQVQGRANVQYNGKKAFEAVWLHLNGTGQLDLRHQKGQPVARRGCVLGCSVGAPNSARKGHPHSIRLDLREADSKGVAKYVVSLESAEEKEHWEACLRVYAGMAAAADLAESSAAAAAASPAAPAAGTHHPSQHEVEVAGASSGTPAEEGVPPAIDTDDQMATTGSTNVTNVATSSSETGVGPGAAASATTSADKASKKARMAALMSAKGVQPLVTAEEDGESPADRAGINSGGTSSATPPPPPSDTSSAAPAAGSTADPQDGCGAPAGQHPAAGTPLTLSPSAGTVDAGEAQPHEETAEGALAAAAAAERNDVVSAAATTIQSIFRARSRRRKLLDVVRDATTHAEFFFLGAHRTSSSGLSPKELAEERNGPGQSDPLQRRAQTREMRMKQAELRSILAESDRLRHALGDLEICCREVLQELPLREDASLDSPSERLLGVLDMIRQTAHADMENEWVTPVATRGDDDTAEDIAVQ